MSRWGKGGFVGINRAIARHEAVIKQAEKILIEEHGKRHADGEHELCPLCQETIQAKKTKEAGL